ncbi:MAG: L,D-transpeptidase family protein, partial [Candidatus Competibacteraceae bacterium]|nr:L,D-transpeptidase family protein [Candidatus Competibacteraceae bacterium]
GYQLRLVEQGEDKLKARVIVGRSKRPTPIFSADMSYLVFSPYWYVPRTIMVEDKLPILRKNPYALRKQGIRIFSGNREIDPGSVNWSNVSKRSFSYSMRQDPGKYNALGDIKFMFPNQHSVYIHDTSSPRLFERDQRAFSSGCVRIDSPVELAEYLLRDTKWDRDTIVKASQRGRERRVDLQTKVPVYMLYWTSWVDSDGTVQFRDDIYDRDTALAQALFSS